MTACATSPRNGRGRGPGFCGQDWQSRQLTPPAFSQSPWRADGCSGSKCSPQTARLFVFSARPTPRLSGRSSNLQHSATRPGMCSRKLVRQNGSWLLAGFNRSHARDRSNPCGFDPPLMVRLMKNVGLRVAGVGVFAAPSASLSGGEPKTVRLQPPDICDRPTTNAQSTTKRWIWGGTGGLSASVLISLLKGTLADKPPVPPTAQNYGMSGACR